jgi:hypothetical protein
MMYGEIYCHLSLPSEIDRANWPASRFGRFNPEEDTYDTHWTETRRTLESIWTLHIRHFYNGKWDPQSCQPSIQTGHYTD